MNIIGEIARPLCALATLALACSCAAGGSGTEPDAADVNDLVEATDTEADATTSCTSNADCDDGVDCTEDQCTVSRICQHTAIDSRCPEGTYCHLSEGCIEGCEVDADCDNGLWCDGDEHCRTWGCEPAMSGRDCNDGNDCTRDACDEDRDTCTHDLYPECEVDAPADLAGDAFDPAVHYNGTFRLSRSVEQECPGDSYNFNELTFSDAGGNLTVMAGPFTLTQSPRPGTADFVVTGTSSCMTVTFSGTFANSDNFIGHWVATSRCSYCGDQDITLSGVRL
jgi:hypothetical protein